MKFFTAIKHAEFATKLFSAAGLNFEAMFAAGDENALKAHLATIAPSAQMSEKLAQFEALTAENATLNAALASAKTENEEAKADLLKAVNAGSILNSALAAAGVKLPAATADKPLDQAAVTAAIDTRVSLKAREQLAKHGINDPLPVDPAADASTPAAGGKKVISYAEFSAMNPGEKMKFFQSGGKLADAPV